MVEAAVIPDPRDQWSLWQQGKNTSFDGSELREWAAQREHGEVGFVRLGIDRSLRHRQV